jgi:hypothetical protein
VDKKEARKDPHIRAQGKTRKASRLSNAFFPGTAGYSGAIHISTALTKKTFNFYFYLMLKRLHQAA